jgi:hypothetical protein
MAQVKKQFSAAAKTKCSHGTKNFQSARDFEAHTGISGISADYVFPRGLPEEEYQGYLISRIAEDATGDATDQAVVKQLCMDWDELVALNPELEKVSVDKHDGQAVRDALFGAASQYNTDDINFFYKRGEGMNWDDIYEIFGLSDTRRNIELTTGHRMSWVAAPETLQKTKLALEAKTGRPIEFVVAPENKEKIISYLAQKWSDPGDTPKQTAEVKAILEGPVKGWYSHIPTGDLWKIGVMLGLNKGSPSAEKRFSMILKNKGLI